MYNEVIGTLYQERNDSKSFSSRPLNNLDSVIHGSAGLLLLGRSFEALKDPNAAMECYSKCLEISPFMFEAFERLSALSCDGQRASIPPIRFTKTYISDQLFSQCKLLNKSEDLSYPSSSLPLISNDDDQKQQ